MGTFWYLGAILVSLGCMLLMDARWKLFFWKDAASAGVITFLGFALLILWDVVGIVTGIFINGSATIASGIVIAPEMPIEEPFFLLFLVVCTMIVFTGAMRIITHLRGRSALTLEAAQQATEQPATEQHKTGGGAL